MTPLDTIAEQFYHAFYEREWPGGGKPGVGSLSIEDCYEVQRLVADRRILAGERVVGYKVGCTSQAIRKQFGFEEPICGRLYHPHVQQEGVRLDRSDFANCAIEPEMAIRMGRDVSGDKLSDQDLMDAIAYVSPAIELHHFTFWEGEPNLRELICSGGIHAGLVIGRQQVSPCNLLFRDELFSVYMDGRLVTSATASAIMGGPLHSLRWLATFLAANGHCLKKNDWVIPGSPTELVEVAQGNEFKVVIEGLGQVTTEFT